MQTFESFLSVYGFCLHMHLDPSYVDAIDQKIEYGQASTEIKQLVQKVRAFHMLRGSLCNNIKARLNNTELLDNLYHARGVEQLNVAPEKSICAVSGEILRSSQGVLLLVNGFTPYTVHKRYKSLLYNFWIIVHFPDEIVKGAKEWLQSRHWSTRKELKTIEDRVHFVTNYNEKMFPKKLYIKLKGIAQYIQREFPTLPINHAHKKK